MYCIIPLIAAAFLAHADPEPKIEYAAPKAKGETNPNSPEKGVIGAAGSVTLPDGYTMDELRIDYRPVGTDVWNSREVKLDEKKSTWAAAVKDIPAGKYEVAMRMYVTHATLGRCLLQNPDHPKTKPHVVEVK